MLIDTGETHVSIDIEIYVNRHVRLARVDCRPSLALSGERFDRFSVCLAHTSSDCLVVIGSKICFDVIANTVLEKHFSIDKMHFFCAIISACVTARCIFPVRE